MAMDLGEKILQFTSITGASEDTARKYLEACAGDLNMAVGMHLENPSAVETSDSGSTEPPPQLLSPESYQRV